MRYGEVARAVLERVGGRILWHVASKRTVVGDETDRYDEVIAVRYASLAAFAKLATDPEILAARAHRIADLGARRSSAASRARSPVLTGARSCPGRIGRPLDLRGRRSAPLGLRDRPDWPRHPTGRAARGRRGPRRVRDRRLGAPRAGRALRPAPDIPIRGPQSTPVEGWVECLDHETLAVKASTPAVARRGLLGSAASRRMPTATFTWSSAAGPTG